MALESPATYSEWYWKHGLDAQKAFDENTEMIFSPFYERLLSEIPEIAELSPALADLTGLLAKPPSPGLGGFALGVGVETIDEVLHNALGPMMAILKRSINRRGKETWLTSAQTITLAQRHKISEEYFYDILASEGYEKIIADHLYESQFPFPAIPDIINYARYHGNPDDPRVAATEKFDIPILDYELWEWLSLQKLTTDQVLSLFKRGRFSTTDCQNGLAQIGWHRSDRDSITDLAYSIPNSMLLVQGGLIKEANSEKILKDISIGDIHPEYAEQYLDAILTKPSTEDIVAYQLRLDPELSGLSSELRKVGVHPLYHNLYKELAQQIPPVADIITMAVREAFTPDIARRFGQYEDFPPEFEVWAAKKGLSKEWSQRYWASHWTLPSPQQGFEMLHRGVINAEELHLLLRAQDVMPFWRDKLVDIAYRPLSRVDVRRMYSLGVLNEAEVKKAYQELGYNEENAERMSEFTIRQTRQTLARFTPNDVSKAFVSRYISEGEASSILREMNVKDDDARAVLRAAIRKREWDFKSDQIAGISNLYKKKELNESEARSRLSALRLPTEEIDVLIQKWTLKETEEVVPTWTTAQTVSFLKKGLISRERAVEELRLIGYNAERIEIYLAVSTTT